jgi:GT2 family glycosyltransferase
MKFSVIIPTCHRNDDLARCLERLAPGAQSLSAADYAVIVSDDGRTSTAEVMVRERFPWVRWTQGPRRGPAANRNHGARLATTDWLVFTDDDCLPEPGWLAAYAAAATDGQTVLEGKTEACGTRDRLDMECPINANGGNLWSCNFAVRKQIFEAGFPGAAMEDADLNERLKSAGHRAVFLPAALVRHPWRICRGRAFGRLHAASFARFVVKHPAQADKVRADRLLMDQIRRSLKGAALALREFGGRGWLRQTGLDLYWNWCLWLELRRAGSGLIDKNSRPDQSRET